MGVVANEVREAVEAALAEARARAGRRGARGAARRGGRRRHRAGPAHPARHPPPDRRDDRADRADLRPVRLRDLRGPGGRDRRHQLPDAQHPARPPGARPVGHDVRRPRRRRCLRTHTSPGQIRVMHAERPPIRALLPGRCFRYEAIDASPRLRVLPGRGADGRRGHEPGRPQGPARRVRPRHVRRGDARPASGPATTRSRSRRSPSTSAASSAAAPGCPACGRTGWMTILGAGMVHPVVLQQRRHRPRALPGLRLRHGRRADRDAAPRHPRHPRLPRERPALPGAVPMSVPLSWLRDYVDVELDARAARRAADAARAWRSRASSAGAPTGSNVVTGELLEVDAAPARRPPLADPRPRRATRCSRSSAAPRTSPPASGCRWPCPGAVLPGNRAHRADREDGRRQQRDALLRRRAAPHRRRRRDPDPARRHAPRASRSPTSTATWCSTWTSSPTAATRSRSSASRARSRRSPARRCAARRSALAEAAGPPTARPPGGRRSDDPTLCPRFVGRWVSGVTVGPSPDRVQMRLLAAGMRPVSNVVDATNYVMLELGKPTHAFDAAAVARDAAGRAGLIVRLAAAGERLETLDHVERELEPETLADRRRRAGPLAIAGVMGGAGSEVSDGHPRRDHRVGHLRPGEHPPDGVPPRPALRGQPALREGPGGAPRPPRRRPRGRAGRGLGRRRRRRRPRRHGARRAAGRRVAVPAGPRQPAARDGLHRAEQVDAAGPRRDRRRAGTAGAVPVAAARSRSRRRRAGARGDRPDVAPRPPHRGRRGRGDRARRRLRRRPDEDARHADAALPARPARAPRRAPPRARRRGPHRGGDARPSSRSGTPRASAGPSRPPTASPGEEAVAGDPIRVRNPLSERHAVLRRGLVGSLLDVLAANERHGRDDVAIFEIGKGYARRPGRHARPSGGASAFLLAGDAVPAVLEPRRAALGVEDAKALVALVARVARRRRAGLPAAPRRGARSIRAGPRARRSAGSLAGLVGEIHPDDAGGVGPARRPGRRRRAGDRRASAAGQLPAVRVVPVGPPRRAWSGTSRVVVAEGVAAGAVAATLRAAGGDARAGRGPLRRLSRGAARARRRRASPGGSRSGPTIAPSTTGEVEALAGPPRGGRGRRPRGPPARLIAARAGARHAPGAVAATGSGSVE